jgi:hypothetical protein
MSMLIVIEPLYLLFNIYDKKQFCSIIVANLMNAFTRIIIIKVTIFNRIN